MFPSLTGEKWTGQPLAGKTIFFAFEQRFGDIIQFMRFIPKVSEMGANINIQIPPELDRLFRLSFPEIEFVSTSAPIPDYDYYQYLTSVPAVLNLDAETLFLILFHIFVSMIRILNRCQCAMTHCLKWDSFGKGNPDPDRSIPLARYIRLLKHRNVSFFSFQLGERRKDLHDNSVGWLIHDFASQISDFYDSSLLLKQMDLLISPLTQQ